MTHDEYTIFHNKTIAAIRQYEKEQDWKAIENCSKLLVRLDAHDCGIKMNLEEAVDLASEVKHDPFFCRIIDEIMGFKDGESERQAQYAMSVRGTIKKWKKSYYGRNSYWWSAIFHMPAMTEKQKLILNECSIKETEASAIMPDRYRKMIKKQIVIQPDSYGYSPDGYHGHSEYLTITLNEIGARRSCRVVLGTSLNFREYKDGRIEYLSRILVNLTEGFTGAWKHEPLPRQDRIVENREWFGHRWKWVPEG